MGAAEVKTGTLSCEDANENEKHGRNYEGGCAGHADRKFSDPLYEKPDQCWSVANFADKGEDENENDDSENSQPFDSGLNLASGSDTEKYAPSGKFASQSSRDFVSKHCSVWAATMKMYTNAGKDPDTIVNDPKDLKRVCSEWKENPKCLAAMTEVYQKQKWTEADIADACDQDDSGSGTSSNPTPFPTNSPTTWFPTPYPTDFPSGRVTRRPTRLPTTWPTNFPTKYPTQTPTKSPTHIPTPKPTPKPSASPTSLPTRRPTQFPTPWPTSPPQSDPTRYPTPSPTLAPTRYPTPSPTDSPTPYPTTTPTPNPTRIPTAYPTKNPTLNPTVDIRIKS